jgi:micrococcal nuclease
MGRFPLWTMIFSIILGIVLITQSLTVQNTSLFAHRDGCHRWHSCPSDTGSYVCGDLGYDDECPKKSKSKKEDSDKSKSNSNKKDEDKTKKAKPRKVKTKTNDEKSTSTANSSVAIPTPTLSEGIEISGPVTNVVDGDTLDLSGSVRIRLALVNTPEEGQEGFDSAKKFVEDLCLFKNGEVDIDDGQRQGSFGRDIGVVYCERTNLNEALMNASLATISTEFCDVSEFADEIWAASYCSDSSTTETEIPTVTETLTTSGAPVTTEAAIITESSDDCDSFYPDFCVPSPPPNLNCPDISQKRFTVQGSDPHGFDRDNDGIGCES